MSVHNNSDGSSNNLRCYPSDSHYFQNAVYWRTGGHRLSLPVCCCEASCRAQMLWLSHASWWTCRCPSTTSGSCCCCSRHTGCDPL